MFNKLFNSDKYIRISLTIIASCIFLICFTVTVLLSFAIISDLNSDSQEISPTEKHRIQHQQEAEKLDQLIKLLKEINQA